MVTGLSISSFLEEFCSEPIQMRLRIGFPELEVLGSNNQAWVGEDLRRVCIADLAPRCQGHFS